MSWLPEVRLSESQVFVIVAQVMSGIRSQFAPQLRHLEIHMAAIDDALAAQSAAVQALQDASASDIAAMNNEVRALQAAVTDALAAHGSTEGVTPAHLEAITSSTAKITSITQAFNAAIAALPVVTSSAPATFTPPEPVDTTPPVVEPAPAPVSEPEPVPPAA